jgi:hypothetical protein
MVEPARSPQPPGEAAPEASHSLNHARRESERRQCQGTNRFGEPCGNLVIAPAIYCNWHTSAKAPPNQMAADGPAPAKRQIWKELLLGGAIASLLEQPIHDLYEYAKKQLGLQSLVPPVSETPAHSSSNHGEPAATPHHRAGGDGYCQVCGPSGGMFPCEARLAAGPLGTTSRSSCCTLFGLAWQAYERTSNSASEREWGQIDAYGAIILAAAAAEAFINELAELVRQTTDDDPRRWPPHPAVLQTLAAAVIDVERRHGSTSEKFAAASKALTGQRPDFGRQPLQDFVILMRARDGLIHTKLDVWPAPVDGLTSALPAVVKELRSKNVTATEPGLAANDALSTRAGARWACASAAAMVQTVIASIPPGKGGVRSLDFELNHFSKWFTVPRSQ